jgi:hypothetical protein
MLYAIRHEQSISQGANCLYCQFPLIHFTEENGHPPPTTLFNIKCKGGHFSSHILGGGGTDTNLYELAGAFLDLVRGFDIPVGTVVVLSSTSYLGRSRRLHTQVTSFGSFAGSGMPTASPCR